MQEIKLSIALVTRNRPDLLKNCLKSIFQQNPVWYEIIISDDSSSSEYIDENQALAKQYGVKYIKGPQKGLYSNRNYTAKNCSGTHVRTMDDDHTFPENHFEICLTKLKEDPKAVWVIGEYFPGEVISNPPHPVPPEIHPRGFSTVPKDTQNSRGISCGASIYPMEIITSNILNTEDFKFGSSYLEYGGRLKYLGYRIRHLENTYVIHNFDPDTRSFSYDEESLDSNIYAIMSLSFLYEPTIKNKALTILQLSYYLLRNFKVSKKLILKNLKKVKKLKSSLKK